ncbi:MAG: Hpt protein, partial [Phenylobacterium sp.]|nr:Hpt protein [Phenylobacterium sp.]
GGCSRIRTYDPLIKSQLLYQLSYTPIPSPGLFEARLRGRGKYAKTRRWQAPRQLGLWTTEISVSAVDFAYLEGFLSGDMAVVVEVLELFRKQGATWSAGLEPGNPDWRAVAHTIKGAARGIGANALGEACDTAEFGAPEDLPAVRLALDAALTEISAYLARQAPA